MSSSDLNIRASFPDKCQPLLSPARYKIVHGGRGSAKSWSVARILLLRGLKSRRRVLCARETQRSIAESVHHLLASQVSALGLESYYRVQESGIYGLNGSEFAFAGLRQQGVVNIKSYEDFDDVWVEEAQVVTKKSWDTLIPTIRKPGSEIWATLNADLDTDETYQRFIEHPPEGAVVIKLNWRDNPWFPPELEAERVAWLARDPEGYRNVWEGEPRSVVEGAIYKNEIVKVIEQRRVRPVPHDPLLKVHTIWDLGWNDSTAIIMVQRSSSEVRVIDYIEGNQRTLVDYVSDLETRKYRWGTDYLPHDGRSRNLQTGKSPEEVLRGLGRTVEVIPAMDVEQGIGAARLMFGRCYFQEGKTDRLLDCLKRYRRRVNQTTGQAEGPLHDEYSHGADAFRGLAVVVDRLSNDDYVAPLNTRSLPAFA